MVLPYNATQQEIVDHQKATQDIKRKFIKKEILDEMDRQKATGQPAPQPTLPPR